MNDLAERIIDVSDLLARVDAMGEKEVADLYEARKALKYRLDEWMRIIDEAIKEWIASNGEPLVQTAGGPRRLYVAADKTTKCRDVGATFLAILQATGGDVDAIRSCLSSNAFRYGVCREHLGDDWGNHFEVKESTRLGEAMPRTSLRLSRNAEGDKDE